ncbi:MAG: ADP-glyceromanno-heptose 6-epimerase [Rhodocyclaceae bacterium]|nr:ADP-glyceromanno-heptose 6-epimerase [Rhodocyclaceae bacterium]
MIVVTGGAGFIGSNLVRELNRRGLERLVVVDDPQHRGLPGNLAGCRMAALLSPEAFRRQLLDGRLRAPLRAIFHLGACTDTTLDDSRFMLRNNFEYSRDLLDWCVAEGVPLIYASSAAVYGAHSGCPEDPRFEQPLNVYAESKLRVDQVVRERLAGEHSQIVGLRFFNVYGPGEGHKQAMASVAYHFYQQILGRGRARLFDACDGFEAGEHRRDFLHVDDALRVMLWFFDHAERSGVFNVGTGRSRSFNDVARAVIAWLGRGDIEYVPFPERLSGRYQAHTEADLSALRGAGYTQPFMALEDGVAAYLRRLEPQA